MFHHLPVLLLGALGGYLISVTWLPRRPLTRGDYRWLRASPAARRVAAFVVGVIVLAVGGVLAYTE